MMRSPLCLGEVIKKDVIAPSLNMHRLWGGA